MMAQTGRSIRFKLGVAIGLFLGILLIVSTGFSAAQPQHGGLPKAKQVPRVQFQPTEVLEVPRDPKAASIQPDGTQIFRWLLDRAGVLPVTDEQRDIRAHENLIVIVLGDIQQKEIDLIGRVIEAGGAALIATDTYFDFRRIFGRLGSGEVMGLDVTATKDSYLNLPSCPYAKPLPPTDQSRPEWKLFEGLERVATNNPSYISVSLNSGPFASKLARFQNSNLKSDNAYLAVGGSAADLFRRNPYRFLAVADPSVFLNEMMVQVDPLTPAPDNLEFTQRVVTYLTERDDGTTRTRALFVQNGIVVSSFNELDLTLRPQQPPVPLPDLNKLQEKLVDVGNQILDQLQENDVAARPFQSDDSSSSFRVFLSIVLVMASTWALIFLVRSILRTRDSGISKRTGEIGGIDGNLGTRSVEPVPGVYDRRRQELTRRNNIFEPARKAIREMFAEADVPLDGGIKLPRVMVDPEVRRGDKLLKALRDLWKIGYGQPRAVSMSEWKALAPLLERARQAFVDRKWWFASVGR